MAWGRRLDIAATLILAGSALTVASVLVRREFFDGPTVTRVGAPTTVKAWRHYAVGSMRMGPADAPVTLTEFSDFQCPFCKVLAKSLNRLRQKYPRDIAIIYRNMPLESVHPYARAAAIAAQCAANQGKFEVYHNYLFSHSDSLAQAPWTTIARSVGIVDTMTFVRCLTSASVLDILRKDSTAAMELKIVGTPMLLINEWLMQGAQTDSILESYITSELKKTKAGA